MNMRTLKEIAIDWRARCFACPGGDNDRSAMLDEFIASSLDRDACRRINELESASDRSVYSYLFIAKLVAAGQTQRARVATIELCGMGKLFRFMTLFEIYNATNAINEPTDLFRLRAAADQLKPQDRAGAYLMIYRKTQDRNDLFLAGQALKTPGMVAGFRTAPAAPKRAV